MPWTMMMLQKDFQTDLEGLLTDVEQDDGWLIMFMLLQRTE